MRTVVSACLLSVLILAACSKQSGKLEKFNELISQADEYAGQIEEKQAEIADVITAYNQTVSNDSKLVLSFESGYRLGEAEQKRLAAHIEEEDDASCQSILAHVAELNEEVDLLAAKIEDVYRQLPEPYKVRCGEDHRTVCVRYLQSEHALSKAAADSVLAGVALRPDIMEGFDVWCMFDAGEFSTHVARGTACISPDCYAKRAKDAAFNNPIASTVDSSSENIIPGRGIIGSAATPVSLK